MTGEEFSPAPESDQVVRQWFNDAIVALQREKGELGKEEGPVVDIHSLAYPDPDKEPVSVLEPDQQFLARKYRGSNLSAESKLIFVRLQEQRSDYFERTGEDIIMLQLEIIKIVAKLR